ncbi:MAG: galactokinase [Planctomycetes bacterium]|nr:galactokinase [Planctomycetota bacterium]
MVNEIDVQSAFRRQFDGLRPAVAAFAPGRVNLIGEHVDYNDGLVLPVAIQLGTTVVAAPLSEPVIRAFSAPFNSFVEWPSTSQRQQDAESSTAAGHTGIPAAPIQPTSAWTRYVTGVLIELARESISIPGAALYIDSDLPVAAGLSSSASLAAAVALAICQLAGKSMGAGNMAQLCRRVERDHVGVPCGIMDPFAVLLAREHHALLLDCRDEKFSHVPLPSDFELLIIDSGLPRELSRGDYAERRRECTSALSLIRDRRPNIQSYRDIRMDELLDICDALPAPLNSRVRHIITEIERTKLAAKFLGDGDLTQFGRLLDASHASLRDDFAVSLPQIDELVELVRVQPGIYGVRLTGAGFGGCIIAAVNPDTTEAIEPNVRSSYDVKHGARSQILSALAGSPARILQLS